MRFSDKIIPNNWTHPPKRRFYHPTPTRAWPRRTWRSCPRSWGWRCLPPSRRPSIRSSHCWTGPSRSIQDRSHILILLRMPFIKVFSLLILCVLYLPIEELDILQSTMASLPSLGLQCTISAQQTQVWPQRDVLSRRALTLTLSFCAFFFLSLFLTHSLSLSLSLSLYLFIYLFISFSLSLSLSLSLSFSFFLYFLLSLSLFSI